MQRKQLGPNLAGAVVQQLGEPVGQVQRMQRRPARSWLSWPQREQA
ncbi:hypothetical protein [Amycolatopsis regifaucium]|nr:hypothetical protein [Amycolatopsis regifaucium]